MPKGGTARACQSPITAALILEQRHLSSRIKDLVGPNLLTAPPKGRGDFGVWGTSQF